MWGVHTVYNQDHKLVGLRAGLHEGIGSMLVSWEPSYSDIVGNQHRVRYVLDWCMIGDDRNSKSLVRILDPVGGPLPEFLGQAWLYASQDVPFKTVAKNSIHNSDGLVVASIQPITFSEEDDTTIEKLEERFGWTPRNIACFGTLRLPLSLNYEQITRDVAPVWNS